ncbi:hypothetical protein EON65_02485 [archaeon]|nr:MAG: hypothetical protein EON65_02485 [archaeon]
MSKDNEYQQLMTARSFEDIAALPCVANELPVLQDDALFIPPGAAGHMAKEGIDTLCEEIVAFIESQSSDKPWKVGELLSIFFQQSHRFTTFASSFSIGDVCLWYRHNSFLCQQTHE